MSRSVCEAPPAFVLELLRAAECVAASVQGEQLPCPKLPDDLKEPLNSPSNQHVTDQADIENTTTVGSWDTFQTTNGLTSCSSSSEPPSTAANSDNLHFGLISSILESLSQSDLNEALQSNAESVSRHQTNLGNIPTASLPENSEAGLQLMSDIALQSSANFKIDHHSLQQSDMNRNSCCIIPVPISEKLTNENKFSRHYLESTRPIFSSRESQSDKSVLVAYENRENFPSSYLQESSGEWNLYCFHGLMDIAHN